MHQSVLKVGAHALPGVSIAYGAFMSILWRAVARGFVSPLHAIFVQNGLRWGFDLGFSPQRLPGRRFFNNYSSALEAHGAISKNLFGRLRSHKSYSLFPLDRSSVRESLSSFLPSWCVFPLGAVAKPNEPGAFRPISDHSRTGFNEASCDDHLRHSLATVPAIGRLLRSAFFMAVDDIDAAFPLLPLSPILWPFFLFVWSHPDYPGEEWVHWHVCGDFGAKGLPGTFKIFFSDVVMGMARSEGALTLPAVVHVDDVALIGASQFQVDSESASLTAFLAGLGILVKLTKHKAAARLQFVLGFWWDSIARTRALDRLKVLEYGAMLVALASRRSLSLRELQQAAGRMQRAVLTLPPGAACLLANVFTLMRGLLRPGARRRLSRACANDFTLVASLLNLNQGRGYFAFDGFREAAPVATDASKSARYVGGGYFSGCGRYSWWRYGASASRKPIDVLEGDTVVKAAAELGHLWHQCRVPFLIDNQAFQRSAVKGWSRADRLSSLVRQLFFISIHFNCVFEFRWISTHDNVFADALSRPDPSGTFASLVRSRPGLLSGGVVLREMAGAGAVRGLSDSTDVVALGRNGGGLSPTAVPGQVTSVQYGPPFSSDAEGDGPGPSPSIAKPKARRVPRDVKATICPKCGGPARWACTETGRWGLQRQCDAVFCRVCGSNGVCVCAMDSYPNAQSSSAGRCGTEFPGALTSVNLGPEFPSDVAGDGPGRDTHAPASHTILAQRASIFVGLPSPAIVTAVDEILADRLSASSLASMKAALTHWLVVVARHGWPRVILADDPLRGGKLATFVVYLVEETVIKASSIQNYVWALRCWFKHQRQPDPVPGIAEWDDFLRGVSVVAWMRSEPRKAVPLALLRGALLKVDVTVFWEVQAALLMVMLFFSFSRSEAPCPKSYSGSGAFDSSKHTEVGDVEVRSWRDASARCVPYVAWRLKAIKQDQRMERPEAAGNQDWVVIGRAPDPPFDIFWWLHLFWKLMPSSADPRPPDSPFFRDRQGKRVLTYPHALSDCRELWARVIPEPEAKTYALHGIRVGAYNMARAVDPGLAVAQGGWSSQAHTRYERFPFASVLALPGRMVASGSEPPDPGEALGAPHPPFEPPERPVVTRSGGRLGRARGGCVHVARSSSLVPAAASPLSPDMVAALGRLRSQFSSSPRGGEGARSPPASSSPRPPSSRRVTASAVVSRPPSPEFVRPLPSERVPGGQLPSLGALGARSSAYGGRYGC